MKLVSWNVNGIRAAVKKDFIASVQRLDADILCLQETKAQDDQVSEALAELSGFNIYSNSAIKKGYSGTALLTREKPLRVRNNMDAPEHDQEGRIITAEYETFILVTVYTPNSGSELKRLDYRQQWDAAFLDYLKTLESRKPLIICGDLNVAHTDIDLARPKQNYNKTAGYMQQEIDGINNLLNNGFTDTFRLLQPEKIKYSWWSYRAGARQKNIGWRIDYFLTSDILANRVASTDILNEVMGSDHCPVQLEMTL